MNNINEKVPHVVLSDLFKINDGEMYSFEVYMKSHEKNLEQVRINPFVPTHFEKWGDITDKSNRYFEGDAKEQLELNWKYIAESSVKNILLLYKNKFRYEYLNPILYFSLIEPFILYDINITYDPEKIKSYLNNYDGKEDLDIHTIEFMKKLINK